MNLIRHNLYNIYDYIKGLSYKDQYRIRKFRNKHRGSKILILCNGPSLNDHDLNKLPEDLIVIGLNKINLIFNRTNFRPNYIVAINKHVINQNFDFINSTEIPTFIDGRYKVGISNSSIYKMYLTQNKVFSTNVDKFIYGGHTVTYCAIQLAVYMGSLSIALIGCDHSFNYKGETNELNKLHGDDPNHFDPNYFKDSLWNNPDLYESEISFILARKFCDENNIKLTNCSTKTKLEVLERGSFREWLNEE